MMPGRRPSAVMGRPTTSEGRGPSGWSTGKTHSAVSPPPASIPPSILTFSIVPKRQRFIFLDCDNGRNGARGRAAQGVGGATGGGAASGYVRLSLALSALSHKCPVFDLMDDQNMTWHAGGVVSAPAWRSSVGRPSKRPGEPGRATTGCLRLTESSTTKSPRFTKK